MNIYKPLRYAWLGVIAAGMIISGGCASNKPKPFTAPQADLQVDQFAGTLLSGPQAKFDANQQAQDALSVKVSIVALEHMPADAMQSISSRARLITVTQSGLPVVAVAELTRPARVGTGDDASKFAQDLRSEHFGKSAEIKSFQTALPAGVTSIFQANDPTVAANHARGVSVAITRPAQVGANGTSAIRLGLIMEDQIPQNKTQTPDATADSNAPPAPTISQRETVILDDLAVQPENAAFAVPFRFGDSPTQAVVFFIETSPGSQDAAHVEAFQHTIDALKQSTDAVTKRPAFGPLLADEYSGYVRALRAASNLKSRRAALVYIADQTEAELCNDVALAADDATLGELVNRINKRNSAGPTTRSMQSLGWVLDLTAFEMLSELQSNNKLPMELAAVLTIHCGEAGRHTSSLEEIVKGLSSRQDFQNRLLAENLIYLEDSSPSSRVRAYDWLRALGRAPAGYDPLGDNKQRREALDRFSNPPAQQSTP